MKQIYQNQHFITSVQYALQYISYYHPADFIESMIHAYAIEESAAAKEAIRQILVNSYMCAVGHRPLCQDTGIVNVFIDLGMDAVFEDTCQTIEDMVNQAVELAYTDTANKLRFSIVKDPIFTRQNTKTNAPAVTHIRLVTGSGISVTVAAKGGGSENKSKLLMLNPGANLVDKVLEAVPQMGAGWCPPGILGIGVGGTSEKAMLLAKESLMGIVDMPILLKKTESQRTPIENLRVELYTKINQLGIGAQGVGGLTTVLDVKILDYPTHAVSKPVGLVPNCAASRHAHIDISPTHPVFLSPPPLDAYPENIVQMALDAMSGTAKPSVSTSKVLDKMGVPSILEPKKINLDALTMAEKESWKIGDTLLISGTIYTGRDAAHKKLEALAKQGLAAPVDLAGKFLYYVGPVDPIGNEVVGPAGPTTSTRMDSYSDTMLGYFGLQGMIGKAERGDAAIDSIKKHKGVYLMAVGGAAYLVSKAIKEATVVAFPELGMEAIYKFVIEDMPVTVAVDSRGNSVHKLGPLSWVNQFKI
jgi:fumarate hydratase, class I